MEITGEYYAEDSAFRNVPSFPYPLFEAGESYYEVLRVMKGRGLFVDDHLQRLQDSLSLAGLNISLHNQEISARIGDLIRKNGIENGNIRLVLLAKGPGLPVLYIYCVPFSYPSPELYLKGVPTAVFRIVRNAPNIKHYNHEYQAQVQKFIRENNIYEALLSDESNCITEGSKSNVFFIGNGCLLTAPGEKVLKGITREKVFRLCEKLNYRIVEQSVSINTFSSLEGVFLTGTSPKILPVCRIDQFAYETRHVVMQSLMTAYDELIEEEISRNQ